MEKLAREEFSISCFPVSRWKRRIEDNIQICKSVFLNFLILLKLFPNFASNVFDIKKSDRLESPWNETYSNRIFYLKLSKYRIYYILYLHTLKKLVKLLKEQGSDSGDIYRSWESIEGMAFVRPIKTFSTTPSQASASSTSFPLPFVLLQYLLYRDLVFSRRVRGTRGLKSKGGGSIWNIKF